MKSHCHKNHCACKIGLLYFRFKEKWSTKEEGRSKAFKERGRE